MIWKSLIKFGAKFYQVQHSAYGVIGWVNIGVKPNKVKMIATELISEIPDFYRVNAVIIMGFALGTNLLE